jgi:hypothetical protein
VIVSIALQIVSGCAAIGRVATTDYYVARSLAAVAFGTIALDYGIREASSPDSALLVGSVVFAASTLRNVLILAIPYLDQNWRARFAVCIFFFALNSSLALMVDISKSAPLALITVLPFIAFGLACLGESSNEMPVRRRFILAIGCVLAIFAIETEAWGLLAKSLISDAGASIYYMRRG